MPYLPPANVGDFARSDHPDDLRAAWHQRVKGEIDKYRGLARFLDPLEADGTAIHEPIPWSGFPRILDAWLDIENRPDEVDRAHRSAELLKRRTYVKFQGRFVEIPADPRNGLMLVPQIGGVPSIADSFSLAERPQDEYLEWFVVREAGDTGPVLRIDFTVEPPEYWETLCEGDHRLAVELYGELLGTPVPERDLFFAGDILCPEIVQSGSGIRVVGWAPLFPEDEDFKAGQYNRWNVWNTERGAIHLTQSNNTLFAEINLAAVATQRFAIRPNLDADVDRFTLTACGGFGAVNRNSDPTIGMAVNTFALSELKAMVSNPIGLYVGAVDLADFRDPNGNSVARDQILTVHRGSFEDADGLSRVLRFSVHPPAGANYTLDQCTMAGHSLTTGGPIARNTTVVIHGVAMASSAANPLVSCSDRLCAHPTKLPKYFLTRAPAESCPPPTDRAWEEVPVELAPDTASMIAGLAVAGPRNRGSRT